MANNAAQFQGSLAVQAYEQELKKRLPPQPQLNDIDDIGLQFAAQQNQALALAKREKLRLGVLQEIRGDYDRLRNDPFIKIDTEKLAETVKRHRENLYDMGEAQKTLGSYDDNVLKEMLQKKAGGSGDEKAEAKAYLEQFSKDCHKFKELCAENTQIRSERAEIDQALDGRVNDVLATFSHLRPSQKRALKIEFNNQKPREAAPRHFRVDAAHPVEAELGTLTPLVVKNTAAVKQLQM